MGFLEILKELIDNTRGAKAGTIMARDGIAIQNYVKEESGYDMESVGVEYARILEETKKASSMLRLGEIEEISVSAEGSTIIMRLIDQDYFIAVVLGAGGNFGRARYFLKKAVAVAKKEF